MQRVREEGSEVRVDVVVELLERADLDLDRLAPEYAPKSRQ